MLKTILCLKNTIYNVKKLCLKIQNAIYNVTIHIAQLLTRSRMARCQIQCHRRE